MKFIHEHHINVGQIEPPYTAEQWTSCHWWMCDETIIFQTLELRPAETHAHTHARATNSCHFYWINYVRRFLCGRHSVLLLLRIFTALSFNSGLYLIEWADAGKRWLLLGTDVCSFPHAHILAHTHTQSRGTHNLDRLQWTRRTVCVSKSECLWPVPYKTFWIVSHPHTNEFQIAQTHDSLLFDQVGARHKYTICSSKWNFLWWKR